MALADASNPAHARARSFRDEWLRQGGGFVSTDFVTDETLTLLGGRLGLGVAERWWEQVDSSRRIAWEKIDEGRAERARHWVFRWRDKDFSFTDCTSLVVMKERRLRQVLTTDLHFALAGFELQPH